MTLSSSSWVSIDKIQQVEYALHKDDLLCIEILACPVKGVLYGKAHHITNCACMHLVYLA
jgi:hypothetical protein